MWICMTSPLSLCTGARPEICLSPKNIRIPAQEGRLGFSAARAEGQRAGEERRGEVKTAEEKNGEEKESVFFLGRFPAARFWSVRLAPCSLGPVEQSTGRLPCNWDSSFHTEKGDRNTAEYRYPVSVWIPVLILKASPIQKISNYTQTKSSYIKTQIKSLKWTLIMNRWINISLGFFLCLCLFSVNVNKRQSLLLGWYWALI